VYAQGCGSTTFRWVFKAFYILPHFPATSPLLTTRQADCSRPTKTAPQTGISTTSATFRITSQISQQISHLSRTAAKRIPSRNVRYG
jgi:hypothetical protein